MHPGPGVGGGLTNGHVSARLYRPRRQPLSKIGCRRPVLGHTACPRTPINRPATAGSLWIGAAAPSQFEGGLMSILDVVGSYYDAWKAGNGDFTAVPLAPDFAFIGPVANFEAAEGFRLMAAQAGPMVTSFTLRRQFVDGDSV